MQFFSFFSSSCSPPAAAPSFLIHRKTMFSSSSLVILFFFVSSVFGLSSSSSHHHHVHRPHHVLFSVNGGQHQQQLLSPAVIPVSPPHEEPAHHHPEPKTQQQRVNDEDNAIIPSSSSRHPFPHHHEKHLLFPSSHSRHHHPLHLQHPLHLKMRSKGFPAKDHKKMMGKKSHHLLLSSAVAHHRLHGRHHPYSLHHHHRLVVNGRQTSRHYNHDDNRISSSSSAHHRHSHESQTHGDPLHHRILVSSQRQQHHHQRQLNSRHSNSNNDWNQQKRIKRSVHPVDSVSGSFFPEEEEEEESTSGHRQRLPQVISDRVTSLMSGSKTSLKQAIVHKLRSERLMTTTTTSTGGRDETVIGVMVDDFVSSVSSIIFTPPSNQLHHRVEFESNVQDMTSAVHRLLDSLFAFCLPRLESRSESSTGGDQHNYDPSYTQCLSNTRQDVSPFGERMSFRILRPLESVVDSIRAIIHSLVILDQTFLQAKNALDADAACRSAVQRLVSSSSSSSSSCKECADVVSGCLARQSLLQVLWDKNWDHVRHLVTAIKSRGNSSTAHGTHSRKRQRSHRERRGHEHDLQSFMSRLLPQLLVHGVDHMISNQSSISLSARITCGPRLRQTTNSTSSSSSFARELTRSSGHSGDDVMNNREELIESWRRSRAGHARRPHLGLSRRRRGLMADCTGVESFSSPPNNNRRRRTRTTSRRVRHTRHASPHETTEGEDLMSFLENIISSSSMTRRDFWSVDRVIGSFCPLRSRGGGVCPSSHASTSQSLQEMSSNPEFPHRRDLMSLIVEQQNQVVNKRHRKKQKTSLASPVVPLAMNLNLNWTSNVVRVLRAISVADSRAGYTPTPPPPAMTSDPSQSVIKCVKKMQLLDDSFIQLFIVMFSSRSSSSSSSSHDDDEEEEESEERWGSRSQDDERLLTSLRPSASTPARVVVDPTTSGSPSPGFPLHSEDDEEAEDDEGEDYDDDDDDEEEEDEDRVTEGSGHGLPDDEDEEEDEDDEDDDDEPMEGSGGVDVEGDYEEKDYDDETPVNGLSSSTPPSPTDTREEEEMDNSLSPVNRFSSRSASSSSSASAGRGGGVSSSHSLLILLTMVVTSWLMHNNS